jgi:hypothetical protein
MPRSVLGNDIAYTILCDLLAKVSLLSGRILSIQTSSQHPLSCDPGECKRCLSIRADRVFPKLAEAIFGPIEDYEHLAPLWRHLDPESRKRVIPVK